MENTTNPGICTPTKKFNYTQKNWFNKKKRCQFQWRIQGGEGKVYPCPPQDFEGQLPPPPTPSGPDTVKTNPSAVIEYKNNNVNKIEKLPVLYL